LRSGVSMLERGQTDSWGEEWVVRKRQKLWGGSESAADSEEAAGEVSPRGSTFVTANFGDDFY